MQYENAREADLQKYIPPRTLFEELQQIAEEPNPGEVVRALAEDGLLAVFSPALAGAKAQPGRLRASWRRPTACCRSQNGTRASTAWAPFLYALTEKLTPQEKAELIREHRDAQGRSGPVAEAGGARAEAGAALKSARVRKPSQVYQIVSKAAGDEVCFLLYHSALKPVQERLRNYFQKYLPLAQELVRTDMEGIAGKPGTPQYAKARAGEAGGAPGPAAAEARPGGGSPAGAAARGSGRPAGGAARMPDPPAGGDRRRRLRGPLPLARTIRRARARVVGVTSARAREPRSLCRRARAARVRFGGGDAAGNRRAGYLHAALVAPRVHPGRRPRAGRHVIVEKPLTGFYGSPEEHAKSADAGGGGGGGARAARGRGARRASCWATPRTSSTRLRCRRNARSWRRPAP